MLIFQITVKFRTEREQIKNYVLHALLDNSKQQNLVFFLDNEVFQLTLNCNQLIKAVDRHIYFKYYSFFFF